MSVQEPAYKETHFSFCVWAYKQSLALKFRGVWPYRTPSARPYRQPSFRLHRQSPVFSNVFQPRKKYKRSISLQLKMKIKRSLPVSLKVRNLSQQRTWVWLSSGKADKVLVRAPFPHLVIQSTSLGSVWLTGPGSDCLVGFLGLRPS